MSKLQELAAASLSLGLPGDPLSQVCVVCVLLLGVGSKKGFELSVSGPSSRLQGVACRGCESKLCCMQQYSGCVCVLCTSIYHPDGPQHSLLYILTALCSPS